MSAFTIIEGDVTLRKSDGTEIATVTNPVRVDPTGTTTQPVSAASLPLPTGASTSALQTTGNASIASVDTKTPSLGQAVMTASSPVVIASNQTAIPITDNAGSLTVDTTQLPAALVGGRLDENVGAWLGSTAPTVGQKAMAASIPVTIATDQAPVSVTFSSATSRSGVASAFVTLGGSTSGNLTVLRTTTYVEPTAEAQRSIKSSSANDTAAGTGARTVTITYYDNAGAGPYTETLTMNGTTAVNTVATDIRFIESIVVATADGNGANAGTISLYTTTAGGGSVIGSIGVGNVVTSVGDNKTLWAHHYVAANYTVELATFIAGVQSGGAGTSAKFFVRSTRPLVTNSVENVEGGVLLAEGAFARAYEFHPKVAGFARLTAYVIPSVNNATVSGAFDWQEVPS